MFQNSNKNFPINLMTFKVAVADQHKRYTYGKRLAKNKGDGPEPPTTIYYYQAHAFVHKKIPGLLMDIVIYYVALQATFLIIFGKTKRYVI